MKAVAACLALLTAVLSAAPAQAQLKKDYKALLAFGEELDRAAAAPDFVGLAVAVVRRGEISLLRTYGVREAGRPEPITPDTVFRLASLSKGFASTLAVMEQQDGRLNLQTSVAALVPDFRLRRPEDTAKVTLEDVLAQRTGLPPYAFDNKLEGGESPAAILASYATVKPACPPRQCFTYQNIAYNMITAGIEAAARRPYAEELAKRIFAPLGMFTASVGRDGLYATGNWARPHDRTEDGWRAVPVTDAYYKVPAAGGVNASITDLAKWLIAQMGHRPDVLPRTVLDEVHRKRIDTPPESARQRALKTPVKGTAYALGWRIYNYAGRQLITHSGSVEGFICQIAWLPDRDAGIVVLSNTRGPRAAKIVPAWLDFELDLPKTDWFKMQDLLDAQASPTATGE